MPLPLPDLDTRRWADLTEEGRALIPRYSPAWTDHNVHDPGITLIELFAWLIEQDVYWVNRIPASHRRKFLELVGFLPDPPLPARLPIGFTLAPATPPRALPEGVTVATSTLSKPSIPFRTLAPLTVVPAAIQAVQSFDGVAFSDLTRSRQQGLPIFPWGSDPAPGTGPDSDPSLYLGWDDALPIGVPVGLWMWVQGPGADGASRQRILDEAEQLAQPCPPVVAMPDCEPDPSRPRAWCPPDPPTPPSPPPGPGPEGMPQHHAVRTVWEYHDSLGWHPLDPGLGEVADDTRGLTLEGSVVLTMPAAMDQSAVGAVSTPAFYVRCRMTVGPPDAAPVLGAIMANAVPTEQITRARSTLIVAPGVTPPIGSEPVPGTWSRLSLALDQTGTVTSLAVDPSLDVPEVLVLGYQPATAQDPGSLKATLVWIGTGTGAPNQQLNLPGSPVVEGRADIWTTGSAVQRWAQRPDLDASTAIDPDVALNPTSGTVTFGDGALGRVVPPGDAVLASFDTTESNAGNVPVGSEWRLLGADDDWNSALLGQDVSVVASDIAGIANGEPGVGGTREEDLDHAAGRAVATLWAHERLVDLCPAGSCQTLDQLERDTVLSLTAPERASTLLDFERLALDVPGTLVARARAWAGIDPMYPCLQAPGTVTVVIVPSLPTERPTPTSGLLEAVRRYLDRRRVVCTRLLVVGPVYLDVVVDATVSLRPRVSAGRVRDDVVAALEAFLDPLHGGPAGRGWPFGRDVYRSEILQVIGAVSGVDHVSSLELIPGTGEADCGNLCVGPTSLVRSGSHLIWTEPGGPAA